MSIQEELLMEKVFTTAATVAYVCVCSNSSWRSERLFLFN